MPGTSPSRTLELLIIEDNPGDVRLLQEALYEVRANVNIHVAKDGAEGIAMATPEQRTGGWRPDLILLDLNLPKVGGHEVLARLKGNPGTRQIPIIVLTSSRAESDVKRAYASHANAYLRKPSTLDGLLTAVQDVKNFWMDTATLPTPESSHH